MKDSALRNTIVGGLLLMGLMATGCQKKAAAPAGAGMQGLPVQTVAVTLQPVAQTSEFVATIKSRRSATMVPQVSGQLTQILVRSGDHVKAGQPMMQIDPRQQQATVGQMQGNGAAEEGALRLQYGGTGAATEAA